MCHPYKHARTHRLCREERIETTCDQPADDIFDDGIKHHTTHSEHTGANNNTENSDNQSTVSICDNRTTRSNEQTTGIDIGEFVGIRR